MRWVILLGLLWPIDLALAQHFQRWHYGVEDGLPSNELHASLQDRQGYLWFATDNGLSRFDGYTFKNFGLNDGLKDLSLFELFEGIDGRIWFGGLTAQLGYYEQGQIVEYPFNDQLQIFSKRRLNLSQIYVDATKRVHLGFHGNGHITIDSLGVVDPINGKEGITYRVFEDATNFYSFIAWKHLRKGTIADTSSSVLLESATLRFETTNDSILFQPGRVPTGVLMVENGFLLHERKNLFQCIDGRVKLLRSFSDDITLTYRDLQGRIWIGLDHAGMICFADQTLSKTVTTIPEIPYPTSILEDREGGLWITSRDRGLHYLYETKVEVYDLDIGSKPATASSLAVDSNGIIYAGSLRKMLFILDRSSKKKVSINTFPEKRSEGVLGELTYEQSQHRVWGSTVGAGSFLINCSDFSMDNQAFSTVSSSNDLFRAIYFDPGNRTRIVGPYSLTFWEGTRLVEAHSHTESRLDGYAITVLNRDTSLVGTNNGLLLWTPDSTFQPFPRTPAPTSRVTAIMSYTSDTLLVATKGQGLFVYGPDRVFQLTTENGLTANNLTSMAKDADGHVWLGTWRGTVRLNFVEGKPHLDYFDSRKGFPVCRVNDVICLKDEVFLATDLGILVFKPADFSWRLAEPTSYIEAVRVNDSNYSKTNSRSFQHNENTIQLSFVGISYLSRGGLKYRYRLEGVGGSSWQYTNDRTITFAELAPGNYQFRVAASSQHERWGKEATYQFSIEPPIWATWWFRTAALAIGVILIVLTFQFFLRRSKRDAAINEEMIELQLKALRAQMNPHFIFNVLAAIQSFVGTKDVLAIQDYLSDFAELIRGTLNHSIESWIPVQTEVKLLENYLRLEKIRFQENLSYRIHLGPELKEKELMIPSMLIQPFVENALVHGLANRTESCEISIELSHQGGTVQCIVTDNGIGREAARSSKNVKSLHKSVGITITAKRLELIRGESIGPTGIRFIDLKDAENHAAGTTVIIDIPYKSTNRENKKHAQP